MPDLREIAADIRLIAATREIELDERGVDRAIRLHLRGRSYLDAIKQAAGHSSLAEEHARVTRAEQLARGQLSGAKARAT